MEEVVEEKKKWEMLYANEKSRLDSFQEMILHQFCENKNYFSSLLKVDLFSFCGLELFKVPYKF